MAYIRQYHGSWRAEVQKCNQRKTKCFATKEEADSWAAETEKKIARLAAVPTMDERIQAAASMLATAVPRRVLNAMARVPHDLPEVLDAAIPLKQASGIYFLIKDNEVQYVGQSVDVLGRISRHRREGRDFDAFAYMECAPGDLDRLEALYIEAFVPYLNLSMGKVPAGVRLFEDVAR